MSVERRVVGMFDSGIGGLTVLKATMARLPEESFIYFGDTARLPYGTKSRETVTRFAEEIVAFLERKKLKLLVVACNTVSAYSLERIRQIATVPVVGVIEPGARAAVRTTRNRRVGVIGTRATIQSGAYLESIRSFDPDVRVFSKACPLFVPLVEEGWLNDEVTYRIAERYLGSLLSCGIDTLILGCTHYPLIKGVISEVVGKNVTLIDSAEETSKIVENILREQGILSKSLMGARCEIYVSDFHLGLRLHIERFLGFEIPRIKVVNSEFEEVELAGS